MKNNSYKYQIFLKLFYYNSEVLERIVDNVISLLGNYFKSFDLKMSKINFPVKSTVVTVLKSPHVYKKSRDQFKKSIFSVGLSLKILKTKDFTFIYYFLNSILCKTNCKYNLTSKIYYDEKVS